MVVKKKTYPTKRKRYTKKKIKTNQWLFFGGKNDPVSGNFYSTFDRNEFYNMKIKPIIRFVDKKQKVNMRGDFSEYDGKAGVWAVYSGRKCLDVCETVNIGNEMRQWELMYWENAGRSDKQLERLNKLYRYNRAKKRDIAEKHKKFRFVIVSYQNDKAKREKIEAQYAHANKALYWSPAPGNQVKIVWALMQKHEPEVKKTINNLIIIGIIIFFIIYVYCNI